ncbi:MAG: TatD family hydrolase [Sporomusaceae bacterium]|jgi:TatD DNase family protein|nr:TatD family hydrolase [Sporomusaceae bacterium]
MLFDSHAHLYDKRFAGELDAVLARAAAAGVSGMINVGADAKSSAQTVASAQKYSQIYAAVGIHPHDAKDAAEADYEQFALWAQDAKVVAIGEMGLDYHYDHSPRDVQKEVFIRQLDLARQLHLPVIIHDREAHADVLAIMKKEAQGLAGVFHCFSGSREMAQEVLKMGFYLSLAGPLTFSNAVHLKEVAKYIPLERLLVETDCPYLTPHPHRGKRNEPAYVKLVAAEAARLKEIDFAELAEQTTANTKELFGIKN